MAELEIKHLPNLAVATTRLDSEKFDKIKNEALNLREYGTKFLTGTSSLGTPGQYRLREYNHILSDEVCGMAQAFDKTFDIISKNKIFTNNMLEFEGSDIWVNYQKKAEYLPMHVHEGVLSWVLWVQIPYDIDKERTGAKDNNGMTSCFAFNYSDICGHMQAQSLPISKEHEGVLMMFPSKLQHIVYPFYTSDGERITISGNVKLQNKVD